MEPKDAGKSNNTLLLDIYQRLAVVEAQNDHILQSQGEAAESRRLIHGKLEDLRTTADTVKRLEPLVLDLDRIRERAIGMKIAMKAVWGLFGTVSASAGFLIHYLLYGNKP